MAPKSRRWDRVYEWSNYRLCCSRMNTRKSSFEDVLDPFEVEDGWFRLQLVSMEVHPAPDVAPAIQEAVWGTIERLKLNDADFRRVREQHVEDVLRGYVSLEYLRGRSPLVAREIDRQGGVDALRALVGPPPSLSTGPSTP